MFLSSFRKHQNIRFTAILALYEVGTSPPNTLELHLNKPEKSLNHLPKCSKVTLCEICQSSDAQPVSPVGSIQCGSTSAKIPLSQLHCFLLQWRWKSFCFLTVQKLLWRVFWLGKKKTFWDSGWETLLRWIQGDSRGFGVRPFSIRSLKHRVP